MRIVNSASPWPIVTGKVIVSRRCRDEQHPARHRAPACRRIQAHVRSPSQADVHVPVGGPRSSLSTRSISSMRYLRRPPGVTSDGKRPSRAHLATVWGDTPKSAATSPLVRYVRSAILLRRYSKLARIGHSVRIGQ